MLIYICLFCHAWVGQQHLVGLFYFFYFFFLLFDFIQSYEGKHLTTDTQMPFLEYISLFYIYLFFNGKELCQIVLFYVMVVFTFSTSEEIGRAHV